MKRILTISAIFIAATSGVAWAQDGPRHLRTGTGPIPKKSGSVMMPVPKQAKPLRATPAPPVRSDAARFVIIGNAKAWIGRPVYASHGERVGEITALQLGPHNRVIVVYAAVGRLLEIGEPRVRISARQIKSAEPHGIFLTLAKTEVDRLPSFGPGVGGH